MNVDNMCFERVERFKYLETTLVNQNSILEETESRLRSGNACHYSVQNILSCSWIPKNININIYRTITLFDVLYGCEIW